MSAITFKVGDSVRLKHNPLYGLGIIKEIKGTRYLIKFMAFTSVASYYAHELEFISAAEEPIPNAVKMQQRATVYDNAVGSGGMKYDGDKARMDLMLDGMPNALEQVAQILTFGAKKYADHSWQTVPSGKARYKAALLRHLTAHAKGEINDSESGMPHLAHAACNALFILELEQRDAAD